MIKPKFEAFKGGGNTLGKDWTSEAFNSVARSANAAGGGGGGAAGSGGASAGAQSKEQLALQLKELEADAAAPDVTSVQVRLPNGKRAEARLKESRTVSDLKRWIVASGHVSPEQNFMINAGVRKQGGWSLVRFWGVCTPPMLPYPTHARSHPSPQ